MVASPAARSALPPPAQHSGAGLGAGPGARPSESEDAAGLGPGAVQGGTGHGAHRPARASKWRLLVGGGARVGRGPGDRAGGAAERGGAGAGSCAATAGPGGAERRGPGYPGWDADSIIHGIPDTPAPLPGAVTVPGG